MHAHTFEERIPLAEARDRLRDLVEPHGRTETVEVETADRRTLAEPVTADRNVPHYPRAAMDGIAVHAADTYGASTRSPVILRRGGSSVGRNEAVPVHTGSELPSGADAVVMIEHVEPVDTEYEVFDAVSPGENVAPEGEDVESGERLFDPGHRLDPSDVGLLKSVGHHTLSVLEPVHVAVIPTGEELVQADPAPGEVIETNGLTVSQYVERWGGTAAYRDIVTDEYSVLRDAIEGNLAADIIVTTGGSSVGERDLVPDVVADLGRVVAHGVAIKPGHPVGFGAVNDTPVLFLPGYPVSCVITAVQLLRPALKWIGRMPLEDFPTVDARLDGKLRSEPGVRSFVRVRLDAPNDEFIATRVRASGAGILSSISFADGWVEIPEGHEGFTDGTMVPVQDWGWTA